MPVRDSADHRFLVTAILPLLAMVLIKGVFFVALMPAWSGDDEVAYWADIRSVVGQEGTFMGKSQTLHGRVYPTLVAPIYLASAPLSLEHRLVMVRLIGLFLYALVVYLAYLTARTLWPNSRFIQIAAPTFVALNPKLSFVMASVSTDVLLIFLFSSFLYLLTALIMKPTARHAILLTVVLLVGAWTKQRFLIAFPLAALGLLLTATPWLWRKLAEAPFKVRQRTTVAALAALAAAWKFGPAFMGFIAAKAGRIGTASVFYDEKIMSLWRTTEFQRKMFRQFWGFFIGEYGIQLSSDIYTVLLLLVAAAMAGLMLRAYRGARTVVSFGPTAPGSTQTNGAAMKIKTITPPQWRAVTGIIVQAAAVVLILQATGAYEVYGASALGRYLMVGSLPVALLMSAGLDALAPGRAKGPIVWSLALTMLGLNIVSITAYLMPRLY